MHLRELQRDVGEPGVEVRRCLVRRKDVGQLAGYSQLSLQSNSQDCCPFCRVSYEPVGFIAQTLLRAGDLSGQYEQ